MTLDALIMLMGALVLALPFLQLPPSWIAPIFFVIGAIIIGLGVVVRRQRATPSSLKRNPHFVDAAPAQEGENTAAMQ